LPRWKRAADFTFLQVSDSVEGQLRWREAAGELAGPVYAGVMVLASPTHAATLAASIPDIDIPAALVEAVGRDRVAGVAAACEQITALKDSGAFDGVHLIPVGRYRQMAAALEAPRQEAPR
jgi:hypothetical protein